jgi:hypothetical protein
MFTPSNPNKATYKSYCYCLAIRMLPNCQYNLATLDRQIVSKNLAISFCRTKSNDLVIKEAKTLAVKMTLSGADDVMLTSSSQRQEDTCYIQYSTY